MFVTPAGNADASNTNTEAARAAFASTPLLPHAVKRREGETRSLNADVCLREADSFVAGEASVKDR